MLYKFLNNTVRASGRKNHVFNIIFGTYFNIADLFGIMPYKKMYPHQCGIKINFDILTTRKDLSSYKLNIEASEFHKGRRHFSSSRIHVHEHFQHSCKPQG